VNRSSGCQNIRGTIKPNNSLVFVHCLLLISAAVGAFCLIAAAKGDVQRAQIGV
jgi:hypothetical protein